MTRDEAIKTAASCKFIGADSGAPGSYSNRVIAENFILCALALGMLKLDEPKNGWEKFEEAAIQTLEWMPSSENTSILSEVRELLANTGLKIVEK